MDQIVTITRQGQLTIPRSIRKKFGIRGSTKALLSIQDQRIVVRPTREFWSLSGALHSSVRLTDAQLRKARETFSKKWPVQV